MTRGALPALLLTLLTACGGQPPDPRSAAVAAFITRQAAAAEAAEADGRLAEALTLWQSLLPLPDPPPATGETISRLQREIAQRTAAALRQGEAAYREGNWRRGDNWMLRALALAPGEPTASRRLRENIAARARAQQDAKSGREYELLAASGPAPEPEPTAGAAGPPPVQSRWAALHRAGNFQTLIAEAESAPPKPGSDAAALLRDAHTQLAAAARGRGEAVAELEHLQAALAAQPTIEDPLLDRVATVRMTLSRQWQRTGTGLMQTDLDAAVTALEKALFYNPGNTSARLKLKQAHTLQRNLSKIRQRPGA